MLCGNVRTNGIYFFCSYLQYIPNDFLKRQMIRHGELAKLKVGEKSWRVKILYYPKYGYGRFSLGWPEFVSDCKLKIRDTCLFELVDEEELVFKVSIVEDVD